MFLIMGLTLGFVSTYTEVKLVHGVAALDHMYTHGIKILKWHVPGIWLNTFGSFLLSWMLGMMFAADGLTVMFGAITSTGMSQAYFSWEKFCHDQGWSMKGFKAGAARTVHATANAKSSVQRVWADFRQPVVDFMGMVLVGIRFITAPVRMIRRASVAYTTAKGG